jgi:EAL domain-containing protein (putative c-di-GMP-specific phosphodiesterase class I)
VRRCADAVHPYGGRGEADLVVTDRRGPSSPVAVAAFNTVLAARAISCVYQPIVTLDGHEVVAYEALARGPASTNWSTPDVLVSYAAEIGRLPELDWICRAAACRGALDARLHDDMPIFVNVEPVSSRVPCPRDLVDVIRRGMENLQIVAEITERSVAGDPSGLLRAVGQLRTYNNRIALDDVGADAASQAMMPLLRPDVIKLDRSVVQEPTSPAAIAVADAVRAEANRTGALILAEGIETEEHLAAASALGATLGQGWLLGRPDALPKRIRPPAMTLPRLRSSLASGATPFEIASALVPATEAGRRTVLMHSRAIEDRGIYAAEPTVLLTTFEDVRFFDPRTRERYTKLADQGMLTAVYGPGMPADPAPNIRGCAVSRDDPLAAEWTVIVVGNRLAGGVFARRRDRFVAGPGQAYELVVTGDRDVVLAAATPLLERIALERNAHERNALERNALGRPG